MFVTLVMAMRTQDEQRRHIIQVIYAVSWLVVGQPANLQPVFCFCLGGRLSFRHRTRDRPHHVRTYEDRTTIDVASRDASNDAGNQRYRRRATLRNNQSQTIMDGSCDDTAPQ